MTKYKTFPEECNKRYLFSIDEGSLKERNSFYTRHNSKHNLILIKARNITSYDEKGNIVIKKASQHKIN